MTPSLGERFEAPGRVSKVHATAPHGRPSRGMRAAVPALTARGRCAHAGGEARSGSPLAGPAAVKTCAREPERISRTCITRALFDDSTPAPHLEGCGGIRVGPGSSLKLAFLRRRNPTRDRPPCQRAAPWCAVISRATRLASREPGSRRSRMSVSPALVTRSPDPNGAGPGRASVEPTRGARSEWRARLARDGRRAPACFDPGQRMLPGAAFSTSSLASLEWRGLSAAPGAPERSQQRFARRRVPRHAWFGANGKYSRTSFEPRRGG